MNLSKTTSTIDYGIDLGTTNSAIASSRGGLPCIQKSDRYNKDTTPSCVSINKKGTLNVGDDSYKELDTARTKKNQNPNAQTLDAYVEFKRMMGTDQTLYSELLDEMLTPEQLSAEVLKKLKSYVKDTSIINAAVVTVPAKFENPQIDATQKAAELAGFKYCELLQEPVAASIAYGLSGQDIEGYWIVFDFGGGTFDAALMKVEESIIKVADTEGDNLLGGKNIDYAIVDKIFVPWIAQNFSIESSLGDGEKKLLLRDALKQKAEETKIAFSNENCTTHEIYWEDFMIDDRGQEVIIDFAVQAHEFRQTVVPFFQKSIDITQQLMSRNNLQPLDVKRIVLIGGPTFSPIFRGMLNDQFKGTIIDVSIDPMTAVAQGAALYASTKKLPEELKVKDLAKAQLQLEHASTTVETDEHLAIRVRRDQTKGKLPSPLFVEIANSDESWSSGRSELQMDADVVMVELNENKTNVFSLSLFDNQGNRVPCEPDEFSILQGMKIAPQPLAFSFGVGVLGRQRIDKVYAPIDGLERNMSLPSVGVLKLKTIEDKNPMKGDTLTFDLLQGHEGDAGVRAVTLEIAATAVISSDELPGFLHTGSEVELTVRIDESSRITGEAFFPDLDETVDLEFPPPRKKIPSVKELAKQIKKAIKRVSGEDGLPSLKQKEVLSELTELRQEIKDVGSDQDTRERAKEEMKRLWKRIDRMEDETAWPRKDKELNEVFTAVCDLEAEVGSYSLKSEFAKKVKHLQEIKDEKLADVLMDEMRAALRVIMRDQPDWWITLIYIAQNDFHTIQWKNEGAARMALEDALTAINYDPSVANLTSKYMAIRNLMQDPSVVEANADFERR
jgi:molecular chaperone DnaK